MTLPLRCAAFGGHYHEPLRIHGRFHDLAHLDPFQFDVTSTKVPRPLKVNVRFTSHCFSEKFHPEKHPVDEPAIWDGQSRRAFCRDRYDLSFRLAKLVRDLGNRNASVREAARGRNWMHATTVEIPVAGTRYWIFFELKRAREEQRHLQDLDMIVESAYPANPNRTERNLLGTIRFGLLAGKRYLDQPVSTRR